MREQRRLDAVQRSRVRAAEAVAGLDVGVFAGASAVEVGYVNLHLGECTAGGGRRAEEGGTILQQAAAMEDTQDDRPTAPPQPTLAQALHARVNPGVGVTLSSEVPRAPAFVPPPTGAAEIAPPYRPPILAISAKALFSRSL